MAEYNRFQTIEGLYKSFDTVDEVGAKRLAKAAGLGSEGESVFKLIVDMLYPTSQGSMLSAEMMFNKMNELSKGKNENDKGKLNSSIAKIIRMYYYDFESPESHPLSTSLRDFYKKAGRPSAYTASNGVDKYESCHFAQMIPRAPFTSNSVSNKTSLTYVLVDAPTIDLKVRQADKAETFLNHMPGIIASQLTPYVDVEFTLHRNAVAVNDKPSLSTMSQLKFLLGPQELDSKNVVQKALYDSTAQVANNAPPSLEVDAVKQMNERARVRWKMANPTGIATPNNPLLLPTDSSSKPANLRSVVYNTGMELFLMPQTLLNMDFDQSTTSRYNPVINPTAPFGTILDFSVNVQSSVGVFSFKTASLKLKIHDRSRLVEIADFINPKLYKQTTLWITYGWRAPSSPQGENPYFDFINENMLKREAYGVQSSGVSIDVDGSATVDLKLFTQGCSEVISVIPDQASLYFEENQRKIAAQLKEIQDLCNSLGLTSFYAAAPDIKGATLISAAAAGNLQSFDSKTVAAEIQQISNTLKNLATGDQASKDKLQTLLKRMYETSGGKDPVNPAIAKLQEHAQIVAAERFGVLRGKKDLFAARYGAKKYEQDEKSIVPPPLSETYTALKKLESTPKQIIFDQKLQTVARSYGEFGDVSFGRVFAAFFSSIAASMAATVVDEYQVVFYKLNDLAGLVGGVNIAEFPVDMGTLEATYAKRVADQKGENMTFSMFLEIIRESQFGDMKHRAYGFRDLYKPEEGKLVARDDAANSEIARRALQNQGKAGPFTLPMVDFYIETGYQSSDGVMTDLLTKFSVAQTESNGKAKLKGHTRIMRIHIYDRAAIPNRAAETMMKTAVQGKYVGVNSEWRDDVGRHVVVDKQSMIEAEQKVSAIKTAQANISGTSTADDTTQIAVAEENLKKLGASDNLGMREFTFRDANGRPSFDLVKQEISRFVPTLTVGSNGSMINNVNYSTSQDGLVSTIMMLRNTSDSANPTEPSGAGSGDLPMTVIQGNLSMTTAGCPLLEYMQQFFVDLGTGTSVDNLYNITGLTHSFGPGKFSTEIKFTFADAYGKYEGASNISSSIMGQLSSLSNELNGKINLAKAKGVK